LRRNCVVRVKHVIEGNVEGEIEVTGTRGRGSYQLLGNKKVMEIKRGSTRMPFMENWLWKRPWTCPEETGPVVRRLWPCCKKAVDLL
jgi:hypothetical protein